MVKTLLNSGDSVTTDVICKRCGQCCYMVVDKIPTFKKCPYLILPGNGRTTSCRIYRQRIWHATSGDNICMTRAEQSIDFYNCPFNSKNKPVWRLKNKKWERVS